MKKLLKKDYQILKGLYAGGSFSEMRLLYFQLKRIRDEVMSFATVELNDEIIKKCHTLDDFNKWIKNNFPDMFFYLDQNDIPSEFKEDSFSKFKKIYKKPVDLMIKKNNRIKNIEIWGQQQRLKQQYQLIEKINFSDEILTFYLSNNAFLQVWHPTNIYESGFSLEIRNASKVALAIPNKKVLDFLLINENKINTSLNSNITRDVSILDNALVITK